MAKKSSLSKALDKRKKKSAKKSIKQATPQSENYSSARDKKEKAKPAGYRFKGLDNFGTPTKKQIAADAKKPRSKRKTYFENRKDKSDKKPSKKFESGGAVDINAHSGDSAMTIQNEMFSKGGTTKSGKPKKWIQDAINQEHKGALKKKALRMGLIESMDDKLSDEDLKKLIKKGGVTAKQARLAMRLKKFQDGGMTDVNAHAGDSATTIEDNVFASGGELTRDQEIAMEILNQLGGVRKLQAMTGAHTFIAHPHGVSFKIKNPKVNYVKIILNSKDLYDLEFGRIKGDKYTVVKKLEGYYDDMIKKAFEEETGMYLSLEQGGPILPENGTQADVMENGGETPSDTPEPIVEVEPVAVEPEIEVKLETTQKATIPNVEAAAYAENMIEFMGTNLEGKLLPNGDYVVLSFLFYPIWFYCAANKSWYGNSDKYNSVTAMHISQSRPTPNAEMLTCQQLLDRMNHGIQTYDLGGVLVRQLYPMSSDNAIAHQ